MTQTENTQSIERHPIRGALWGLLLVIVLSVAVGVAWGRFAPPRVAR